MILMQERIPFMKITKKRKTTMLLINIEKQVKPLSRADKWQLIKDVQEMLMQEEVSKLQHLSASGRTYPLFTPVGLEQGAMMLQHYFNENKL